MSHPAREFRQSIQDSEELRREADRFEDQCGVEVEIRVQLALDEELIRDHNSLQLLRHLDEVIFACDVENLQRQLLNNHGTRIVVTVSAVAKAHQYPLFPFDLLHVVRNILDRADVFEHMEDCFQTATVTRAVERGKSTAEADIDVRH